MTEVCLPITNARPKASVLLSCADPKDQMTNPRNWSTEPQLWLEKSHARGASTNYIEAPVADGNLG